jgi:glycosyltransferase involved in cell wall biosynthesis
MPRNVLLLFDVPNWANHAACKALKASLERAFPGYFNVRMVRNGARSAADFEWADLLFSHAFYDHRHAHHQRSISQVSGGNYLLRRQDPDNFPDAVANLQKWKHIVAKNQALMNVLGPEDHPSIRLLYHPFDHEVFTPDGPAMDRDPDVFRVGFAGHTSSSSKGVRIMEEAIGNIDGAELVVTTYQKGTSGQIPHDLMPQWYRSLDCYVCMPARDVVPGDTDRRVLGEMEGGPRPPVEAMLCGVPLITSVGGQIGEMAESGCYALKIRRKAGDLEYAVRRLMEDVGARQYMGKRGRESIIDAWCLGVGLEWAEFFSEVLES